jgi:hypothetical protein
LAVVLPLTKFVPTPVIWTARFVDPSGPEDGFTFDMVGLGFRVKLAVLVELNATFVVVVPETEILYGTGAVIASGDGIWNETRRVVPVTSVTEVAVGVMFGPAPAVTGVIEICTPDI